MQSRLSSDGWVVVLRAALVFAIVAFVTILFGSLQNSDVFTFGYHWQNQVGVDARSSLVRRCFLAAMIAGGSVVLTAATCGPKSAALPELLWRLSNIVAPIAPLSAVPLLLHWPFWRDQELVYLVLVLGVALALKSSVSGCVRARPMELLGLSGATPFGRNALKIPASWRLSSSGVWLGIAIAAAIAYSIWFSYHTVIWHRSARSGWDLSIEDNILWNIWNGGPFFKAAPALGPTGSHFARHSTVIAYLLAPIYAFYQSAEMVLILQSVLMGLAAVPLFLFGRRRVGAPLAALFSVLYLMHPALQESNLFEMHYVKLGTLPFWTTLWLLDSKRYRWALVGAALTLAVREDVATWIVLLGAFGLVAGLPLRTSAIFLVGGMVYVAVVKFVIMPSLVHGQDELLFMYKDLLPAGKRSFAWAMLTVLTNPAYVIKTLLTEEKLIYFLHILTPLVFLPLRRAIGWVALIPGIVFCFLSTKYSPLVDIHFQYSTHLLAMLYPAAIVVLGKELPIVPASTQPTEPAEDGLPRLANVAGTLAAMVVATLLCSSQFGAVIQQNTSRGGPIPYKFGWDEEGRIRYAAIEAIRRILPKNASVAASAFTITQVSARSNAYSLSISEYDAEYIVATTNRGELVPDEYTRLQRIFAEGTYGVVAVRSPFFLMRRGHSTEQNAQVQSLIR